MKLKEFIKFLEDNINLHTENLDVVVLDKEGILRTPSRFSYLENFKENESYQNQPPIPVTEEVSRKLLIL